MEFFNNKVWGNTLYTWLMAVLITVSVAVALVVTKHILVRRLTFLTRRTKTDLDDLIVDLLSKTRFFPILAVSVYAGLQQLTLSGALGRLLSIILLVILSIQGAIWVNALITYLVARYIRGKGEEDASAVTTANAIGFAARIILYAVILLLALDNIPGVDINTLLAGLGIGGIAVALAVQNILSDLFASLSILLDKPFVAGDFIIVGEYLGTVERIGLKTTRIRSLSGEQLIFSNTDLLSSRIRNYKRMYERRVVFKFGVVYQTPPEKLEKIPSIARELIEALPETRFDRAHFSEFGDSSLNFEVVYWILTPDYNFYMDTQQAINLGLYRRFQQEGIEFAYPTQTVLVTMQSDRTQSNQRYSVTSEREVSGL